MADPIENENPLDDKVEVRGQVVVVLTNTTTGKKRTYEARNLVTTPGSQYYAERGALLTSGTPIGPVPSNFTDTNGVPDMVMELWSDAGTPNSAPAIGNDYDDMLGTLATGSSQAIDGTYPLVNDTGDADNTGDGPEVLTYRVSYATGDANLANISDVILTNPSPGAAEPLLMHAEFGAPFTKTSADTLKVFVNHTFSTP